MCSNDTQISFKSATWFRRFQNINKLIKKDFLEGKSDSSYHCNLFDFASFIDLELEVHSILYRAMMGK